jgi:hypothetical protein
MSDRYDDLSDAEKTALDEQIVERDSGDPNSDREYLQDLPPADAEDASDDTELNDTDVAVEEGRALMDEEDER